MTSAEFLVRYLNHEVRCTNRNRQRHIFERWLQVGTLFWRLDNRRISHGLLPDELQEWFRLRRMNQRLTHALRRATGVPEQFNPREWRQ